MFNRHLNTFLKIVECGSFNKAAEALYVSSSAIIQQINCLERELGVSLFHRSRRGLQLTEAGIYLSEEAQDYITRGEQIRARLLEIEAQKPCIQVGTTQEEKCRLLYDLWMLFSPGNTKYDIRLVFCADSGEMPHHAQMIESVKDNAPWQRDWEFLEALQVQLGCALVKDHPLAGRDRLSLQDLRETGLIYLDRSRLGENEPVCSRLRQENIPFETRPHWDGALTWECSIRKSILLVPACWQDILPDLIMLPCELELTVPYGFFYRSSLSAPAAEFLEFIRNVYHGTDPRAIIPVL